MSINSLKRELAKLQGVNDSPVVVFTYQNLRFHLRDLTAEEESRVSEHSYAQVELAASEEKGSFSRSMRAMMIYRMAYVAVAIRKIDMMHGKEALDSWNLDVHMDDPVEEGKTKFAFLLDTIRGWGKDLASLLYESLEEARRRRNEFTKQHVHIEGVELPPQPKEGEEEDSRFTKHERLDDDVVEPGASFA